MRLQTGRKSEKNTFRNANRKKKRALVSVAQQPVSLQEPFETQPHPTPTHGGRKAQLEFQTVKQRRPADRYESPAVGQNVSPK